MIPTLNIGKKLAGWMALAMCYALAVTWYVQAQNLPPWTAGNEVAGALTVALGILIGIRTHAANDRWWEARKLWGQLINDSRNLALKVRAHLALGTEESRQFGRLLAGFAHALRLHLRGDSAVQSVPGFEKDPATFPHSPGYVAERIHQALDRWNRQGHLRDTLWILDVHARALLDICGACERIRNTRLASSYRAMLWWGIVLHVVFAPWAVALEMGWWGLVVLAVGFSFLLGVELTAEAVEEPFGRDGDDLPLRAYCQTIENFVTAALAITPQASANGEGTP